MLVSQEEQPHDVTRTVNEELKHLREVAAIQRIDLGQLTAAQMLELDLIVNPTVINDPSPSAKA